MKPGGRWDASRAIGRVQGLYFLVTGLWPFLSPGTFATATGIGAPAWMFRPIGCLLTVVGWALLGSSLRGPPGAEARRLGQMAALAVAWIDYDLIRRGVIGPVNWWDIALQIVFAASWALAPRLVRAGARGRCRRDRLG